MWHRLCQPQPVPILVLCTAGVPALLYRFKGWRPLNACILENRITAFHMRAPLAPHDAHAAADRLQDPEVKDLDFMHVKDHPQELLASVAADGSCVIWHLQVQHGQLQAQQLTQLEPPKSEGRC